MSKYIFVTGGVLSSLGKGITAASIGALLEGRGYKVAIKKFDPYLNFSTGKMSPLQHGEVFVTEDGEEGDLDLGHYERFTTTNTNKYSDLTSGKIFYNVIQRERRGEYLGSTVQVIPHITDEIKLTISQGVDDCDIVIVEIGGTTGDIEGLPFLEAIRQMRLEKEENDVIFIHVTLIPYIKMAGELKTKPTQHSVKKMQEIGISPDILVCRSEYPIEDSMIDKLALFCNVDNDAVISCVDASTIYQVPLALHEQRLDSVILKKLDLEDKAIDLSRWKEIVRRIKKPQGIVKVGVIGKYLEMKDAYISLTEALLHGAVANSLKADIVWIDAETLENEHANEHLDSLDCILIPGGFGERGVEGKIKAVNFARSKDIPFLGISMGMHVAVVEFARNVLKLHNATTAEINKIKSLANADLVIDYQHDEHYHNEMEETMRLGAFDTKLLDDSLIKSIYETDTIAERHRHRLELNNDYKQQLEENGLIATGISENSGLVDVVEIEEHRWFVACQFHPEFKSKPFNPHPLIKSFIEEGYRYSLEKQEQHS